MKTLIASLSVAADENAYRLLTEYGPVALVWFDTPRMMTGDRATRFTQIVRSLSPDTLIDGRLGEKGDYGSTGDNVIPAEAQTEAWEPGKVFITFFEEPRAAFEIPAMKNRIKRAYRLEDGVEVPIKSDGGKTVLNLQRPIWNPMATVVVLEIEGDKVER